jgi:ABC-type oligopeptide transport system ATPase subunit
MPLLEVRNLSIDFYTSTKIIHTVRGVSFDVAAGERVGLVGESGSGKTTSALALMRMIKPPGRVAGGTASLGDLDLLSLSARQMRDARLRHLSYVPQGAMNSLNPVLQIRDRRGHHRPRACALGQAAGGRCRRGAGERGAPRLRSRSLPASALRRHEAARLHRDCNRHEAPSDHRRRTHERARRGHPAPDRRGSLSNPAAFSSRATVRRSSLW